MQKKSLEFEYKIIIVFNYDLQIIKDHGEPMTAYLMVTDIFYIPRSIRIEKTAIDSQLLFKTFQTIFISLKCYHCLL